MDFRIIGLIIAFVNGVLAGINFAAGKNGWAAFHVLVIMWMAVLTWGRITAEKQERERAERENGEGNR